MQRTNMDRLKNVQWVTLILYLLQRDQANTEELTQCLNGPTEIENLACVGQRINIKKAYYGKTKDVCSNGIQPDPHNDCIVKTEDMIKLTRDLRHCNGAEKCRTYYPEVEDIFFNHCGQGFNTIYGHVEYECVPKTNIPYLEFCPRNGIELTEHTGNKFYFFAQDPEGHDAYKSISFEECSCSLNSTTDRLNLNMKIMDFSLRNYGDESLCPFSINGNDSLFFSFKHCATRSTAQLTYDFTILGPEVELKISQKSSENEQELYLFFFIETDNDITLKCSKPILKRPSTTTITTTTTTDAITTSTQYSSTTVTSGYIHVNQPAEFNPTQYQNNQPHTTGSFLEPLGIIGFALAVGCLFFFVTTIVACVCACYNRSIRNNHVNQERQYFEAPARDTAPPSYLELMASCPDPSPGLPYPVLLDKTRPEQPTYINTNHRMTQMDYEIPQEYLHCEEEYLSPRN